jgi:hypothetical protein
MTEALPSLRLPKLPERTLVKLTIALTPELSTRLNQYAKFYGEAYGQGEPVRELIPYMLKKFIDDDRSFAKRSRPR